jgi:hypothetical protein
LRAVLSAIERPVRWPIVSCVSLLYAAARAFVKVAMFIRLSAMTPNPTHRCMPSTPW